MVLTDRVGSTPTSGTSVWQAGQKAVSLKAHVGSTPTRGTLSLGV
ncbi:MAG: hypothetical protein UY16_C0060G0006 [Candidatus Gottesmanbacteria bacterium GW2011_GWA2_47_9]|uniref:Uncharacterized protein n=1 Tax=Candidatus Gottesmanbacteria bacterium GW2011_GWA2_47_9 TaxID=1618445 RepID=A0A0G1TWM8_9BACT|nr:MAG: hypothetical protein UY16_C0060G0006 [Candidatus Gottesmanbacteria bacterium GW2011_GWA2_47_9]